MPPEHVGISNFDRSRLVSRRAVLGAAAGATASFLVPSSSRASGGDWGVVCAGLPTQTELGVSVKDIVHAEVAKYKTDIVDRLATVISPQFGQARMEFTYVQADRENALSCTPNGDQKNYVLGSGFSFPDGAALEGTALGWYKPNADLIYSEFRLPLKKGSIQPTELAGLVEPGGRINPDNFLGVLSTLYTIPPTFIWQAVEKDDAGYFQEGIGLTSANQPLQLLINETGYTQASLLERKVS